MSQSNDMAVLTDRSERLISAITDAILSSAEAAAERISMGAEVARVRQRMAAFTSVLDVISISKTAAMEQLKTATGAMKNLLERQVELFTTQELAVLEKAGASASVSRQAIAVADARQPSENGKAPMRQATFSPAGNGVTEDW